MRNAFVKKLEEMISKNKNIYLLTGDLGFSVFDRLKEEYPDNYINVGLSEANMVGMAAGMAMEGKVVFIYSIIPFITYRVLEHIRNDICEQNLPVKIVGVGEGITYGTEGPTHHAIEDIGVMASLPNLVLLSPGDPIEVEKLTEQTLYLNSPVYLRLGRSGEKIVNSPDKDIKIGKGNVIRNGNDLAIIVTGNMLPVAFEASEILFNYGLDSTLVSMHTIKPLDETLLKFLGKKFKNIFIIEEHISSSGLAQRISYFFMRENINVKVYFFGFPDEFIKINGKQEFLRQQYGLDSKSISDRIIKIISSGGKKNEF